MNLNLPKIFFYGGCGVVVYGTISGWAQAGLWGNDLSATTAIVHGVALMAMGNWFRQDEKEKE